MTITEVVLIKNKSDADEERNDRRKYRPGLEFKPGTTITSNAA